jgi:uncharacterized OB-fold protein
MLLFKHKLSQLSSATSEEALLKQTVQPVVDENGLIQWKGRGKKTVDLGQIRERFKSLGVTVDWRRVERIQDFRNEIEHYYTTSAHDAIRSVLSDSFVVMNDFIRRHLNTDAKVLLGDTSWSVLIQNNKVYEQEKAECEAALARLTYYHDLIENALAKYSCDACGSGLIAPHHASEDAADATFICRVCNEVLPYDEIVKRAVLEYYSHEVYLAHTDGNDMPIADCPECGGVYLYGEEICSGCGHSAEHTCQRCHAQIPPEELAFEPFCGYCAHVMSKDD